MSVRHPLLSSAAQAALGRVGRALELEDTPLQADVALILAELDGAPPDTVVPLENEIRHFGRMGWWQNKPSFLERLRSPKTKPGEVMTQLPAFAWLLLFHANGRLREAALARLPGPPTAPFLFAALAYRLNDWVPQVRSAAVESARRLFPLTSPDIVATASLALLDREFQWSRWDSEAAALYDTLDRDDVATRVLDAFKRPASGPQARRFRLLARFPRYASAIPDLMRTAFDPTVRAVALAALLKRRVEWPVGYALEWINKASGTSRRVLKMEGRSLDHAFTLGELIEIGLRDPSGVVRRLAADAFTEAPDAPGHPEALLDLIVKDRSPAVRMRAAYMVRHGLVTGANKKAGG